MKPIPKGRAEGRNSGRSRTAAFVAWICMALLFAAAPALAQSLRAPTLWATWYLCQATLHWTHENPDNLRIYNFQYRIRPKEGNWTSWKNIAGGASSRQTTVLGLPEGGDNTFQVRATALTVGSVILGSPSNSMLVRLLDHNHIQCARQVEHLK